MKKKNNKIINKCIFNYVLFFRLTNPQKIFFFILKRLSKFVSGKDYSISSDSFCCCLYEIEGEVPNLIVDHSNPPPVLRLFNDMYFIASLEAQITFLEIKRKIINSQRNVPQRKTTLSLWKMPYKIIQIFFLYWFWFKSLYLLCWVAVLAYRILLRFLSFSCFSSLA